MPCVLLFDQHACIVLQPVEHPHGGGNHQHIGKASTVRRDCSAGKKVRRHSFYTLIKLLTCLYVMSMLESLTHRNECCFHVNNKHREMLERELSCMCLSATNLKFSMIICIYPQMMTTHVPLIRSRGESYPPKHLSERGYKIIQNIFACEFKYLQGVIAFKKLTNDSNRPV